MVGQIRDFEDSNGLGLEALSAMCPHVLAGEVVVGEGLVCDRATVDCLPQEDVQSDCTVISHLCWRSWPRR